MSTDAMTIRMVDTIGQFEKIRPEIEAAFQEILSTGAYINGPWVNRFQENLATYLGAKKVVPCANGTDALQVALMALDLKPGTEVITCPFTFFATGEVIALLGLKPIFVDVDPESFNIDPAAIEAAITPNTGCIIPVHLFGRPAEMEPIMNTARKHGIPVVEDAAQAIGSEYTFSDGTTLKAGLIGDLGCTSFYPSKNLGAYGDGGAIYTNREELGDECRVICSHGSRKRYYHDRIGVNSRLDSLQAAVLDIKLKHLDEYNDARRAAADLYDQYFNGQEGLVTPVRPTNATHVFHQYTLRILEGREKRDQVREKLNEMGIPNNVYYPVPLHMQDCYREYGYKEGDFPISEALSAEVISLPMHSELEAGQVSYIAEKFLECYNA